MSTDIERWMRETENILAEHDRRIRSKEGGGGSGGGAPSGPAGGSLTGTYPNPTLASGAVVGGAGGSIADGTITDVDIAAANKDGAAATPSMRTLGTGAQQAAAGDDPRLSNARTPTAHTHSADDITSGVLNIARIPTGTSGTTVALGNHTHTLSNIVAGGSLSIPLVFTEQALTPGSIPAGSVALYAKTDGKFYTNDETGVERVLVPAPTQLHLNASFDETELSPYYGFCGGTGPARLVPSNWNLSWCSGTLTWVSDETQTYDGLGRSLRFDYPNSGGATGVMQMLGSIFAVTPGSIVTISTWVRGTPGTVCNMGIYTAAPAGDPSPFGAESHVQWVGNVSPTLTWQKITASFTIPAGHTKCRLDLYCEGGPTGTARSLWWDETTSTITLAMQDAQTPQLHLNPNLDETASSTVGNANTGAVAARLMPVSWNWQWSCCNGGPTGPTLVSDETQSVDSAGRSLKITMPTDTGAGTVGQWVSSSTFSVVPGALITLSFWHRTDTPSLNIRVGLMTHPTSDPAFIVSPDTIQQYSANDHGTTSWKRLTATFQVPNGHTKGKMAINVNNWDLVSTGTVWIDKTESSSVLTVPAATHTMLAPALAANVWSSNIVHNMNFTGLDVQCMEEATGEGVLIDWKKIDANTIQLRPDVAYAANTLRISISGRA